jgi:hypothetical protein
MSGATGVALLVIRAWCEDGATRPLRAEVRVADDVATGLRPPMTFVDVNDVIEAVRNFLAGAGCSTNEDPLTLESRLGDGRHERMERTP